MQFIRLLLVVGLPVVVWPAAAQTWTQVETGAPSQGWLAIASSADGSKLIAGSYGYLYCISTNSGSTWTTNNEPQINSGSGSWNHIALSADGTGYAGANLSSIWVSTNAGASWSSNSFAAGTIADMCMSADGKKVVVAASGQFGPPGIFTSTNSGVTWSQIDATSNYWVSVACSADGNKIVAAATATAYEPPSFIYTSTNFGTTWTPVDSLSTNLILVSVASSADGAKLVAASAPSWNFNVTPWLLLTPGLIYTTTNSGTTWITNNAPNAAWVAVASSADGSRLAAISEALPYTSTNSGATWTTNSGPTNDIWQGIVSSADGNKLVAFVSDQSGGNYGIWTLQTTPSPQVTLTPSPTNLTLGWTIPSTNFVLQQSAGLASWSVVTNPPLLNLTNLQNQVTFPSSGSNGFFRLKTP